MPSRIESGSTGTDSVATHSLKRTGPSARTRLSQVGTVAKNVAERLQAGTLHKFSKLVACFGGVSGFFQSRSASLNKAARNLRGLGDGNLANRHVDCELPVTKQVKVQNSMSAIDALQRITHGKIWSDNGDVNLSFIEHFCGLREKADEVSPNYLPASIEGQTEVLAPYQDFTLGVVQSEISLIDSMLHDMNENDSFNYVKPEVRAALAYVSQVLKQSANMMTTISRAAMLESPGNGSEKVSLAAQGYLNEVDSLPPGGKLIVPLVFFARDIQRDKRVGHATYMVIEKNYDSTVNLHMVNRGSGSGSHAIQPGGVAVPGKHPKTESAVSKWNLPVRAVGGLSQNFLENALRLTLDVNVAPDGNFSPRFNADPNRQMSANIAKFYHEFGKRYLSQNRPVDRHPVYQRPQKDGNCAYSNLKSSIRYLLNDQKMYNEIDLLKTEKLARLTSKYMLSMLPETIGPGTAVLNRYGFSAEQAATMLLTKYEKAEFRWKMDSGAALPFNLPAHLRNVTN